MHPRCNLDATQINLDPTKIQILFQSGVGVGGKINLRIRLTSAKVEVEAELVKNPDP